MLEGGESSFLFSILSEYFSLMYIFMIFKEGNIVEMMTVTKSGIIPYLAFLVISLIDVDSFTVFC